MGIRKKGLTKISMKNSNTRQNLGGQEVSNLYLSGNLPKIYL